MSQEMFFHAAHTEWESGLPLGNGTLAGLLMGNAQTTELLINHEKLFLPWDFCKELPDLHEEMEQARQSILHGDPQRAAEEFCRKSRMKGIVPSDPTLTGCYPNPFHPAFGIDIFLPEHRPDEVRRQGICFDTGEIFCQWTNGSLRAFANKTPGFIAVSLKFPENVPIRITLKNWPCLNASDQYAFEHYVSATEITQEGHSLRFRGQYKTGGGWSGSLMCIEGRRIVSPVYHGFDVRGEVLLLIRAENDPDAVYSPLSAANYFALLERHLHEYRRRMGQTELLLDNAQSQADNAHLIEVVNSNLISPALLQRMFYMGKYLLQASCGQLPPNAQGIWGGHWNGRVMADYVLNIELEMAHWPLMSCGMEECTEGLFNFIRDFVPDWRENAARLYGCRGILVSSRSTTHGLFHHFSPTYIHSFWTGGAAWLANLCFDCYLYRRNTSFLRQRILPFMEEAFLFYWDFLRPDLHERVCFVPSVSPENTPGNSTSMAAINASSDISAVRTLCMDLLEAYRDIKASPEKSGPVSMLLNALPEYLTDEQGALKEWCDERFSNRDEHRHLSHLYCAYPSHEAKNGEVSLSNACRTAMENRLLAHLGDEGCGWSWGHAMNICARMVWKDLAYDCCRELLARYVRPNLMTMLTDQQEHMQLDANCAMTAALLEMLVYSYKDQVAILPCWPDFFGGGTLKKMLLRGGHCLEFMKWDDNHLELQFSSTRTACLTISLPRNARHIQVNGSIESNQTFCVNVSSASPIHISSQLHK